jgi:hypothetical protein
MITWLSTKSPSAMLDDPIDAKIAKFLRENAGIDAALLAVDLGRRGISRIHIEAYRRRLAKAKASTSG